MKESNKDKDNSKISLEDYRAKQMELKESKTKELVRSVLDKNTSVEDVETSAGEEGKKLGLPQEQIDKAVKKIVTDAGVFNRVEVHGSCDRITANSLPVISAQALKNLIDNFGMQALYVNGGVAMYFPAETLAKYSSDDAVEGDSKNE